MVFEQRQRLVEVIPTASPRLDTLWDTATKLARPSSNSLLLCGNDLTDSVLSILGNLKQLRGLGLDALAFSGTIQTQ